MCSLSLSLVLSLSSGLHILALRLILCITVSFSLSLSPSASAPLYRCLQGQLLFILRMNSDGLSDGASDQDSDYNRNHTILTSHQLDRTAAVCVVNTCLSSEYINPATLFIHQY